MSDSAETADFGAVPTDAGQPVAVPSDVGQPVAASAEASWSPDGPQPPATGLTAEHPEVLVGAAFAGGLVLAKILKRFAA